MQSLADVFVNDELKLLDKVFDKWARKVVIPSALIGLARNELETEGPELIGRFSMLYFEYPNSMIQYAKERINRIPRRRTKMKRRKKRK